MAHGRIYYYDGKWHDNPKPEFDWSWGHIKPPEGFDWKAYQEFYWALFARSMGANALPPDDSSQPGTRHK